MQEKAEVRDRFRALTRRNHPGRVDPSLELHSAFVMEKAPILTSAEIDDALGTLPKWRCENDALQRDFEFADFRAAMAFMLRAGFEAEARDHHPEWTNVYHRVKVRLTTHDAGNKVTAKDVDLARAMNQLAE